MQVIENARLNKLFGRKPAKFPGPAASLDCRAGMAEAGVYCVVNRYVWLLQPDVRVPTISYNHPEKYSNPRR